MAHRRREGCRLQCSIVKLQQAIEPGAARSVTGASERLERSDAKVSQAVLRGPEGGTAPRLPDRQHIAA